MDRREAVKSVAFLIGGALSATTIATLFDSCNTPGKDGANFTAEQEKMISEIADIILPTTKMSPGAKAANVGPFISMMLKDCYPQDAQQAFAKGLEDLETRAKKDFGKSFLEMSVKDREQLLGKVRDETVAFQKDEKNKNEAAEKLNKDTKEMKPEIEKPGNPMAVKEKAKTSPQFFAIARDLTMLGYFTSEIGATKAYEYIAIPGRYDGCADLKPGQRVWA